MLRILVNRRKELLTKGSLVCWFLAFALSAHAASPLTPGDPIALPGTHGGFDFIRIDTAGNRLLLAHEKNKTLDVFSLDSKKLVKAVPTGTVQDVGVDEKRGNYYASGNDPGRFVIVSIKGLKVTGELPMPKDTDLVGYDPVNGLFYMSNDTAAQTWVIDPAAKKVVTTIDMKGGGVEDLVFDQGYQHLFQAVKKGSDSVVRIDTATNKVLNVWPIAPDTGPHGMALVSDGDGLLVACDDNLVLMSRSTGKILDRAPIAKKVDQVAYDPGNHLAYAASEFGEIGVVRVTGNKLTKLDSVPDEKDATSIVVDPKTHTVWIAYSKGSRSFVQPFTPAQ